MRYGVQVATVVRKTYVLDAASAEDAITEVQTLLDAGEYDDTESARGWSSDGAEVAGVAEVTEATPVDPEFQAGGGA